MSTDRYSKSINEIIENILIEGKKLHDSEAMSDSLLSVLLLQEVDDLIVRFIDIIDERYPDDYDEFVSACDVYMAHMCFDLIMVLRQNQFKRPFNGVTNLVFADSPDTFFKAIKNFHIAYTKLSYGEVSIKNLDEYNKFYNEWVPCILNGIDTIPE